MEDSSENDESSRGDDPDRTRIGVDVGGTFTDVVLVHAGRLTTVKVPSTADQSVGVMDGIEAACDEAGIAPSEIDAFTHAMTVSVNALLEGSGAKTALVTTEGFRDVAEIGRQNRPALYDLDAEKPEPLVPRRRRYEVGERATVDGIETEVDPEEVRALAADLNDDVEAVAVALLHAYAHPDNERAVAEALRTELDAHVSVSHEVLGEFREYERTATTVVDAYVTPEIDRYLSRLIDRATDAGAPAPRIMQANGGVADAGTVRDRAVTTCLSGPAAGVVGAGALETPVADLVTFDMGGTSSDVSLVRDGEAERTTGVEIAGRPIGVPMVDVETVGAGGGSIARIDAGGALRVGPRSAGVEPGPACYGRGGEEPTVTDADVVLGYIGENSTLGGEVEIDVGAAEDALADLAAEAGLDGPVAAARGVYRVANANMTRAVRAVTVERGHDPRTFALAAFGGAGPMHAAAMADALEMDDVVVPYAAGVLSAYGLLAAGEKHDAVRTHRTPLAEADPERVESILADLAGEALGRAERAAEIERAADLRYLGQSFELTVPLPGVGSDSGSAPRGNGFDADAVAERFHEAHESAYGYRMAEPVELVSLRATAVGDPDPVAVGYEGRDDPLIGRREAVFGDERRSAEIHERGALSIGATVSGPGVLEGSGSTTVVPPDWTGRVLDDGTLHLERDDDA